MIAVNVDVGVDVALAELTARVARFLGLQTVAADRPLLKRVRRTTVDDGME